MQTRNMNAIQNMHLCIIDECHWCCMAIKGARKSDLELQWGIEMSKGIEHLFKLFLFAIFQIGMRSGVHMSYLCFE
jgi:hypothetical protein